MRKNRSHLFRACSSKGVSHHHLHLSGTQRQAESREELQPKKRKGKLQVCYNWRLFACGPWRGPDKKLSILYDWFGEHTCPFLIGPELEAYATNKEAGSNWPIPDPSGMIAVGVWLTRLVVTDCGLEFYCHIWSGHCPLVYSISEETLVSCPRKLTVWVKK